MRKIKIPKGKKILKVLKKELVSINRNMRKSTYGR
jgi:hypothetical protein